MFLYVKLLLELCFIIGHEFTVRDVIQFLVRKMGFPIFYFHLNSTTMLFYIVRRGTPKFNFLV